VREQMTVEIAQVEAAATADRERAQSELDALREAFSDAAAEVEAATERHREELARLEEELHDERAEVARLRAAAATVRDESVPPPRSDESVPPPLTDAAKERAAAPRTQPLDTVDRPDAGEAATAADDPLTATRPSVLDPPGPLRAGGRPATPDGTDAEPARSRVPGWLRGDRAESEEEREPAPVKAFAAVKALLGSNGRVPPDDEDEDEDVPLPPARPLRSASAARARAEASVARRRSPLEVWGARIVAAIFVVVMLVILLQILIHIA
jgi:translation initiation factor IF-2